MNSSRTLRTSSLALLLLALFSTAIVRAQAPVTYDKVLELMQLEVKEEKIIAMIESSPTRFTLGEDQIDKLKKAGASEKLIAAMQKKGQLVEAGSDASDFVVILDCSGSMNDSIGDGSKWQAAQQAAIDLVDSIPNGRKLAVIIYGYTRENSCEAVKVLRPLGTIGADDKKEISDSITKLRAVGNTPIALSLRTAMKELAHAEGLSQVVLITDGMETCKGDPAAEAMKLAAMQNGGRLDVIGFTLSDKEGKAVAAIAASGKGKFYDAKSIKELANSVKEVKKTISKKTSEDSETKDMEAAAKVKPSTDPTSPQKLPLGQYVSGRLGTEKSHYWLVDLEPGDYQFVWEPKRSDDEDSNLQGRIEIGDVEDGQFKPKETSKPLNEIDYRARLIFDYSPKEKGPQVVRVLNRSGIVDYNFAVYKKGQFSTPFLTKCPVIQQMKVGEEITTGELDAKSIYNNSEYYRVKIPAEDCFIDLEVIRSDGEKSNVKGNLLAYSLQGERIDMEPLVVNDIGVRGKARAKLILAEEMDIILRVKGVNIVGPAKYTAKFKVSTAADSASK